MELTITVLTAVFCMFYLAFGFALGIFREWAFTDLEFGSTRTRRICAFFCFPLSTATFWEFGSPHAVSEEGCYDSYNICDIIGGGLCYWILVAFVWPLTILWLIPGFFVVALMGIIICLEKLKDKFCNGNHSFEKRIKSNFGIPV
jgi:hypothetical protein